MFKILFIFWYIKRNFLSFVYFSELKAQNDETLDKIYENQDRIDASREWLLEDKAGVAPRWFHFDVDSVSDFECE